MWRMGVPEATDIGFEDLTEPQGVLPDQFFSGARRAVLVEGERRLMVALLEDAVRSFRKHAVATNRRGRRLFREVEAWFMEQDTGAALTFEYVCEASGLDADSIRSNLRRWHERRTAQESSQQLQRAPSFKPTTVDELLPLKKASGDGCS